MRLVDSRRLTGVNFDLATPGAIAEVAFDPGDDVAAALAEWSARVAEARAALGWEGPPVVRRFPDDRGAALAFPAPLDALYVATEVNEWAVERAALALAGAPGPELAARLPEWRAAAARESLPGLAALRTEARARGLPLLLDDDALSLGAGRGSRSWPRDAPPAAEDVPWDSLSAAPIALITGTNGKTTTARLLARIAKLAGHVPGNTSTDGLAIDERPLEEGDWTGPGAARIVLRDPRVTLAVLEVARGGILRRGLGVDRCDAACVTNISPDHLGEYGIDDLDTMARAKAVVGRVVAPGGRVVLGADSPPLLALADAGYPFAAPLAWFSLDPRHPRLARHRADGGDVYFLSEDGVLTRGRGVAADDALVPVAELAFCFGGAARHNVANALAAAALASALGLPDAAIAAGLRSFAGSPEDNPGRANYLRVGDVQVFLDFAHNPDGIASLAPLLARLRGDRRLLVSIGVAGDRRDDDIRAVARAVLGLRPDRVITRDLEHYLRGRAPGEVPALLEDTLVRSGVPTAALERASGGEVDVLRRALAWAGPGDLIAVLVHVDRDEVLSELRSLGARPG